MMVMIRISNRLIQNNNYNEKNEMILLYNFISYLFLLSMFQCLWIGKYGRRIFSLLYDISYTQKKKEKKICPSLMVNDDGLHKDLIYQIRRFKLFATSTIFNYFRRIQYFQLSNLSRNSNLIVLNFEQLFYSHILQCEGSLLAVYPLLVLFLLTENPKNKDRFQFI